MDKEIIIQAYLNNNKSIRKAAKAIGIPRRTFRYWVSKGYLDSVNPNLSDRKRQWHSDRDDNRILEKPIVEGQIHPTPVKALDLPEKRTKRYILTSAQNNTHVNEEFWKNLIALKQHYKAELFVGTYTYNHSMYRKNSKYGTDPEHDSGLWFDDRLAPYIALGDNENIDIAPGLRWCGRANILPTADRPLSGFETYTGLNSGIFPHAKIAMQSIPSGKFEQTKLNYTTGTVTQRNYIQKKAGLKAEHHHTYGALVVEVCPDGTWFVRQINADSSGVIHDLCLCITNGIVEEDCEVLAINWGDIHQYRRDNESYQLCWGKGGMMDTLKPRLQFMHDVIDFYPRNHHEIYNHHAMFTRHIHGNDSVEDEMEMVADFLLWSSRTFCKTVVVASNHDDAFRKWLRDADYRKDPVNAIYFLQAQLAYYHALKNGEADFHLLRWAMLHKGVGKSIQFLKVDESFIIADNGKGGGIECGMHGHIGPNGSRGNAKALSKVGRKANIGHSHQAEIHDGLYVAGVTGKLDMVYNVGPSSWSQSHIITYLTGKRSIITFSGNKWKG